MTKKIITTIILLIIGLTISIKPIYATTSLSNVIAGGKDFISAGEKGEERISQKKLQNISSTVYNILLVLGIVIAIIIGAVLGIKFMTEGVEGQADVKKALIPYILGCAVVFGAFGIWKIVVDIMQEI